MKSRLLDDSNGQKTYALVFDAGDEAMAGLLDFAQRENLAAAQLTGIGAFSDVVLGYFDWQTKEYQRNPVADQVEVLSFLGDVALKDGKPQLHVHVVCGLFDGRAVGGHLLEAHVRPTLEVVLTEPPAHLRREHDPESGLALIRL